MPGDIFQLGNTSYASRRSRSARSSSRTRSGQPPTMPFWFGEAPARSDELSAAVSRLRETALEKLDGAPEDCEQWLEGEIGLDAGAADQLAQYLAAGKLALGLLPTLDTIVFERFFDEVGDTHLVIHSPYGSRVNRAWGLALRKRFCRQFNFELQASALEDSIVLSLGPTHSFPLEDVQGLPEIGHRERRAGAGAARRADVRHALALERHRRAGHAAHAQRQAPARPSSSARTPRTCLPSCSRTSSPARRTSPASARSPITRWWSRRSGDCLHETMDVDGFLTLLRRIEDGSVNRRMPRPDRTVAAVARHPRRASLRVPRRRRRRGAAHALGLDRPFAGPERRRRPRSPRSRRH